MKSIQATLLLLAAVAFSGCQEDRQTTDLALAADHPPVDFSELQRAQDQLYVASNKLWLTPAIPVCWEVGTGPAVAIQENWVRDAVEKAWSYFAPVDFVGWGTCEQLSNSSSGIRITIKDSGVTGETPHTRGLGRDLNGLAGGMLLNFTFQQWSQDCQQSLEFCIRTEAVHEFGHALGFAHEQLREDKPDSCTRKQEDGRDLPGNTYFGAWDIDSVMNYCNPKWDNYGQLSATDIAGVQSFYGVRSAFAAATTFAAINAL